MVQMLFLRFYYLGFLFCFLQIGDLKGLFGLLMVNMQMLRAKLKILDVSYGTGTGRL